MEDIGKFNQDCFRATLKGRRITQHHAPSPDFAVGGENHADGPVDPWSCGMYGTGSVGGVFLLELNSTESHRLVRTSRTIRFAI